MRLVLTPGLLAQRAGNGTDKGWVPLFNGKDLTGWKELGDPREVR